MQDIRYRNLLISGIISVIGTPFVGGAVMGYLEGSNTTHNVLSGVILGSLLALFLGIPYVILESYIGTMLGESLSVSHSLGLLGLVALAVIVMSATGSLLGGFVARLTRQR